jgi:hypothetical protein
VLQASLGKLVLQERIELWTSPLPRECLISARNCLALATLRSTLIIDRILFAAR